MTDYAKILPKGKKNAVLGPDLARQLCMKNTRQLRADIANARAEGQLICSSSAGGYYIPETREELQGFICTMEAHAKSVFRAIRTAREAMKQIDGQMSFTDNTGNATEHVS